MNSDGKMHPTSGNSILNRRLRRLLLSPLAALDAQLLGLDLEDLADRTTPSCSALDDRPDEVREGRNLGPGHDVPERVAAVPLPTRISASARRNFLGEGSLSFSTTLPSGAVEPEACADGRS